MGQGLARGSPCSVPDRPGVDSHVALARRGRARVGRHARVRRGRRDDRRARQLRPHRGVGPHSPRQLRPRAGCRRAHVADDPPQRPRGAPRPMEARRHAPSLSRPRRWGAASLRGQRRARHVRSAAPLLSMETATPWLLEASLGPRTANGALDDGPVTSPTPGSPPWVITALPVEQTSTASPAREAIDPNPR